MIELSIVIPVYRSHIILPELMRRIDQYISPIYIDFEVLLIDDFSNDDTWEVIIELKEKYHFIKAFKNDRNLGQPKTTIHGISQSFGKYIVTIDDDLEYCPSDIVHLYEKVKHGNSDVIFGIASDKYKIQGKIEIVAKFRNKILNLIWKKPITDSFKIFKRSFVFDEENRFKINSHFEGFLNSELNSCTIDYMNVSYNKRYNGKSNYTLIRKIKMFLQMHEGFKSKN